MDTFVRVHIFVVLVAVMSKRQCVSGISVCCLYLRFDIPKTEKSRRNIKDVQLKSVVDRLQDRFPNIPEVEAIGIFNPQRHPSSEEELNE